MAKTPSPTDRLRGEAGKLATAYADHTARRLGDKVSSLTDRLNGFAENGGGGGLLAAAKGAAKGASLVGKIKGAFTGKGKSKGKGGTKVTNIVESIDVGVPIDVAYNQWTQFEDFPSFMKKVESVEQQEDTKVQWKAQVLWSHRTWESTIVDQQPDDHIVWRSSGQKGYVNGAVTFHELAPNLTRILVILEYHPQGFFEHTGNMWRAQGRRVRLELKHFARHVMNSTLLEPDKVQGWRGDIQDGEVVSDESTQDGGETEEEEEEETEEPEEEETEEESRQ